MTECDCAATTEGKWAGIHSPECQSLKDEPAWSTKKDAFGRLIPRYQFRGRVHGWVCQHCGGSWRSERGVQEHQSRLFVNQN